MKRNLSFTIICSLALLVASCTKQPYFNIPVDENGQAVLTTIASGTNTGVTTMDPTFTITATLPNAKTGDVIKVECLKAQAPTPGAATQLLPVAGSQKTVTLASDLKATVVFTRAEANLINAGDAVTVTFAGKTDSYTSPPIAMGTATIVPDPAYQSKAAALMSGAGVLTIDVKVTPKSSVYAGSIVVSSKSRNNDAFAPLATYGATASIPVDGSTFAAGRDTMYYRIVTSANGFTETLFKTVVTQRTPYFFLKKTTGVLSLATSSKGGWLLTTGASTTAVSNTAQIVVNSGSLAVKAGPAWVAAGTGRGIQFVASTVAAYTANSSATAKATFEASSAKLNTAEPSTGEGVYIFKLTTGTGASNTYYGFIKFNIVTPGDQVTFEYRIGDIYPHLLVIK